MAAGGVQVPGFPPQYLAAREILGKNDRLCARVIASEYIPGIFSGIKKVNTGYRGILHYALELLFEEVEAFLDIFEILTAGENDLAGREQECNDLGILDPVHEARELLGFVFDILKVQGNDNLIKVDVFPDIVGTDDIGDSYFRFLEGIDARGFEGLDDNRKTVRERLLVPDTGQHNLSRGKNQRGNFRVLDPVHSARESLGIEFAALDLARYLSKVDGIGNYSRCYDVLNL
jgi:hypothetical protein